MVQRPHSSTLSPYSLNLVTDLVFMFRNQNLKKSDDIVQMRKQMEKIRRLRRKLFRKLQTRNKNHRFKISKSYKRNKKYLEFLINPGFNSNS